MKLDIRSHTDSRANKYNESLSEKSTIYHRLVNEKQVDKSRLTAKGYGKPTHK
jgi:outer membrane protein OmpA-like peptidoglycan-associated protein